MKKLLGLSTLFYCLQASAAWNVNDVSILFDLPKNNEELSYMIGADSKLFSTSVHDLMKPLVTGAEDMPKEEYKALRVVGARIDPCFKYVPTANKCFAQMRLVWQPIGRTKLGDYVAMDAGVHTFYELNSTEFKSLLARMSALKNKMEKSGVSTTNAPLNIHPALKNSKTRMAFMTEMKSIVTEFGSKKNLSRATFMKLFTEKIWWAFGGFEFKNGETIRMKIARMDEKEEVINFFNDDFNAPMGMRGAVVPELKNPTKADDLSELLKGYTYTFSTPEGKAYVKKSFETLDKVENPNHFNSENMDCVHCHMASSARAWLEYKDRAVYQANYKTPYRFNAPNTTNTSANIKNPKSLRIFGYLGATTAIGQRVINESVEVTRILNSK